MNKMTENNDFLELINSAKQKTENQLSRGGSSAPVKIWRPSKKENNIRILPSWKEGSLQFWREIAQHWNLTEEQKGPVMCPKLTPDIDEECPVCELVAALRLDKTNLEAAKLVRDIRAKKISLVNVIDLNDAEYTASDVADAKQRNPDAEPEFNVGDPKVQVYTVPVTVMDTIFGLIKTSKSNITDLETGRNIMIKKIPNPDPRKTQYQVYPDFNPTKVEMADKLKLNNLDEFGFTMGYEQLYEQLQAGVASKFVSRLALGGGASHLSAGEGDTTSVVDLEAEMKKELSR